jgi:hypothetical protein
MRDPENGSAANSIERTNPWERANFLEGTIKDERAKVSGAYQAA